jgi:hypothetical protein
MKAQSLCSQFRFTTPEWPGLTVADLILEGKTVCSAKTNVSAWHLPLLFVNYQLSNSGPDLSTRFPCERVGGNMVNYGL